MGRIEGRGFPLEMYAEINFIIVFSSEQLRIDTTRGIIWYLNQYSVLNVSLYTVILSNYTLFAVLLQLSIKGKLD